MNESSVNNRDSGDASVVESGFVGRLLRKSAPKSAWSVFLRERLQASSTPAVVALVGTVVFAASIVGGVAGGQWFSGALVGLLSVFGVVVWLYAGETVITVAVSLALLVFVSAVGPIFSSAAGSSDDAGAAAVMVLTCVLVLWPMYWLGVARKLRAWVATCVSGIMLGVLILQWAPTLGLNAARLGLVGALMVCVVVVMVGRRRALIVGARR